jgi:hypothetical protein
MADTLSETQGCDLLARLFKARGYTLQRNVVFREYGVEFHIDGWDPKARVGFEFLTSEDDDHDDLTLEEYKTLTAAQRRGELALFVIDEVEPLSAADLAAEVHDFLDEVADATRARLKAATRRGKAAKRAAPATAKKKSAKRKPATKRGAKTKVAAAAKPAARKKAVSKPPRKAVAKRRPK